MEKHAITRAEKPAIKRVIYSDPVTTIIWADGTKTQSRCDERDNYDELTGFMMCVFKKIMKHKDMRKMFDTFVYGDDKHYVKRDNKKKQKINLDWLDDIVYLPSITYDNTHYTDKVNSEENIIDTFEDMLNELYVIFKE
jgi:hypothetical protein